MARSPSAIANHPLSMWTDDLGWLGGSGLPTLNPKQKKKPLFNSRYKKRDIKRTFNWTMHPQLSLTFSRVCLHEWEGCVALSDVPDTEHAILPSCGYNVLLVWMSVHTVQRDSVSWPEKKKASILEYLINKITWMQHVITNLHMMSSYRERIWDGELFCCLKSHILSWPMEFTVKISVVLR